MSVSILAKSLLDVADYFDSFPEITEQAAVLAVNDAAEDTLPSVKREMRKQINFPSNYLNPSRLGIRRKAVRGSIEAVISGRDRPTSLARFAEGATPQNSRGRPIFLKVKNGQVRKLARPDGKPSAFLVNLRSGNIGLAVRLRPGEKLENSEKAVRLDNNVYLLYGPSVDQVLRDVADTETPDIARRVSTNFFRQFARLSRG